MASARSISRVPRSRASGTVRRARVRTGPRPPAAVCRAPRGGRGRCRCRRGPRSRPCRRRVRDRARRPGCLGGAGRARRGPPARWRQTIANRHRLPQQRQSEGSDVIGRRVITRAGLAGQRPGRESNQARQPRQLGGQRLLGLDGDRAAGKPGQGHGRIREHLQGVEAADARSVRLGGGQRAERRRSRAVHGGGVARPRDAAADLCDPIVGHREERDLGAPGALLG